MQGLHANVQIRGLVSVTGWKLWENYQSVGLYINNLLTFTINNYKITSYTKVVV